MPTAINQEATKSTEATTPKKAEPSEKAEKKTPEMFGTQTEKSKHIWIYQNGDKNHQGAKLVVHHTKFRTFEQLKEAMTKQVHLPTGPVMQVFALDGKSIKSIDELEDEGKYIVAGPEKLNKAQGTINRYSFYNMF